MLGWGGGCCGDAFSDGVAYNPASNTWRALPRAPLPGSQHPIGAWTGKEYVVLAGSRGAAYSPARNAWRSIAAAPAHSANATAVWNGADVVVAGGSRNVSAYNPAKNRWRPLPRLPVGRVGKVVSTDVFRVLVWGGARGGASLVPGAKKWTAFARGPLPSRIEPTAVWTGTSLIVWGGLATKTWGKYTEAGAAYVPPQLACGDAWMAENLRVTQSVKEALRRASGAAHPPLPGHTYYGRYSGTRYAIASFGTATTVFRTDARNHWHVRTEARGAVCTTVVPVELLKAWSLRPLSRRCYALPR
jgi:hypothetical protein